MVDRTDGRGGKSRLYLTEAGKKKKRYPGSAPVTTILLKYLKPSYFPAQNSSLELTRDRLEATQ